MTKLTAKQEAFCNEFIIDLNASQAALRAKYSEKTAASTGNENLQKPEIQARIAELNKDRLERVKIDADWVLLSAKKVFDRCMQEEEVMTREGEPAGVFKFEPSAANKALEIIGKHVKVRAFDVDAKETNKAVPINVTIGVKDCSVEQ